jgi:hypothetical protein
MIRHIANIVCFILIAASAGAQDKYVYDTHSKRDPFIPLVGITRLQTEKPTEILSIDDVDFQGIAFDAKGERIIIVNGEMLREGSELDALKVIKIKEKEATISIRDKEYRLNLQEK